jgi:peptide deformylase
MILPVLKYGHPALRQRGSRIEKITPEIARLIADMFETMYAARGVGLAAQQVGHAVQLTVIDVSEITDRPSTLHLDGQPTDVRGFMPLALINPEVKAVADPTAAVEGCLSFPEIYAEILRPDSVQVVALNAEGERIEFQCGGLLARAVQHEVDHLHGILFIDRMSREKKQELKVELEDLRLATKAELSKE